MSPSLRYLNVLGSFPLSRKSYKSKFISFPLTFLSLMFLKEPCSVMPPAFSITLNIEESKPLQETAPGLKMVPVTKTVIPAIFAIEISTGAFPVPGLATSI